MTKVRFRPGGDIPRPFARRHLPSGEGLAHCLISLGPPPAASTGRSVLQPWASKYGWLLRILSWAPAASWPPCPCRATRAGRTGSENRRR